MYLQIREGVGCLFKCYNICLANTQPWAQIPVVPPPQNMYDIIMMMAAIPYCGSICISLMTQDIEHLCVLCACQHLCTCFGDKSMQVLCLYLNCVAYILIIIHRHILACIFSFCGSIFHSLRIFFDTQCFFYFDEVQFMFFPWFLGGGGVGGLISGSHAC
jgi:hypothetical protein